MSPSTYVKLTLENQPEIGGIAILKLVVKNTPPGRLIDTNIGYLLPEGLEFINDKDYKVIFKQTTHGEWGQRVTFYSGPMEEGEQKEFVFRVSILDGRRCLITGFGGDNNDTLEIDPGDPEPPEWEPQTKERAGTIKGREHISTGIKRIKEQEITELIIPKEELPPLRTELRMRTKERPSLGIPPPYPWPFRYLIYTEKESPQVEVYCILPNGFEIENEQNDYKLSQDEEGNVKGLLYSGPMHSKECIALYFKVKRNPQVILSDDLYLIKTETGALILENEKLFKTDSYPVNLGRKLY